MIKTRDELDYYLLCDKVALMIPEKQSSPNYFDYIWKYEIALRHSEYFYYKCKENKNFKIFYKIMFYIWYYRFRKLGVKLNIEIWLNQFGPGLSIAHAGGIVVNGNAIIGSNCRIHEGVTIGSTDGENGAARIGDNVFIGSGAKIIGDLVIADNVAIGAGAVVVSNIEKPGITVGGIPAKIISNNDSSKNLVKATSILKQKGEDPYDKPY